MKTIPLTVLCSEGPMSRAYLGVLHSAGFRVERLILMISKRDPGNKRPISPWLPLRMRRTWAKTVQDLRMNYWPRQMVSQHAVCKQWMGEFAQGYSFNKSAWDSLTERPTYKKYAEQIDELLIEGLDDLALEKHLRFLGGPRAVLFTGGGRIPASLIEITGFRFIHIHPGLLPSIRGADALLWSILLMGHPTATAFYLAPGLDTGDIIASAEFKLPVLPDFFPSLDTKAIYRFVYSFIDPMLRAQLLLRLVSKYADSLYSLPATTQSPTAGNTFHFMNERMRKFTFDYWSQAHRSGPENLNGTISGNSAHNAVPRTDWREGVFNGQEICTAHTPYAHGSIQSSSRASGTTRRPNACGTLQGVRVAS